HLRKKFLHEGARRPDQAPAVADDRAAARGDGVRQFYEFVDLVAESCLWLSVEKALGHDPGDHYSRRVEPMVAIRFAIRAPAAPILDPVHADAVDRGVPHPAAEGAGDYCVA